MTPPFYGIFVMPGAKLVVSDQLQEGSNKALIQGGAFLIIEGDLYFNFWHSDYKLWNINEMEEQNFFPKHTIADKTNPIIFLLPYGGKSFVWYLTIQRKQRLEFNFLLTD